MTTKTQGTVQALKKREKGYSVCINNTWYSSYEGSPEFSKGDQIDLEYTISKDGQWKNIKSVQVLKKWENNMKEAREDKTHNMLVSYAKDLMIALLPKFEGEPLELAKLSAQCIKTISKELGGEDENNGQRPENIEDTE